ncbi:MAG: thermonuclease family protein [Shinella sp.]|nr:thermonuclease family protein [Shinella sp.]
MESTARFLLFPALFFFPACAPVEGAERIAGPVEAEIVRIVDGDTLLVSARPWPQQSVEVYVRLRGIDTPELRAQCPATRQQAKRAKAMLAELLENQTRILLTDIEGDKFFGRVVADVQLSTGGNPAYDLIATGLAVPYEGGARVAPICAFSG